MFAGLITLLVAQATPALPADAGAKAPVATTEAVTVATVPVLLEGSPIGLSELGAAVDRAMAWRPTLRALRFEEVEALHPGAATAVRRCGSDRGCLADSLKPTGASLALVVVVRPQESQVILSTQLVDLTMRRVQAGASESAAREGLEETLARVAAKTLDEAGHAVAGGLRVEVIPPEAEIEIKGQQKPITQDGLRYHVTPGSYEVVAKMKEHDTQRQTINVGAAQESVVRLELEPEGSIWTSPWLWLGIGAVVAGAAVTTAVVANSGAECLCFTYDPAMCPPSCSE